MKLLLAQIIDAHLGSSGAGLRSVVCVDFAVSFKVRLLVLGRMVC